MKWEKEQLLEKRIEMMDGVLRLDIKPLTVHWDGRKRHTTLTSFEEVLKNKEENGPKASWMAQSNASAGQVQTAQSNTSAGQVQGTKASAFYDPATGQPVSYQDVAETAQASQTANKVNALSTTVETTMADSMKQTKYDAYFKEAARKYNVSESLLKGIAKAESNFNPKCRSGAGAMGIMQLMPTTAQSLGVTDPYDPRQNIMGGAQCISQKLKEFHGDLELSLAAYNAGSGAVKRYGSVPSFCKAYVNKVISYKKAFETAKAT